MRVLCIMGPREGDSGRRTHSEPDGAPSIEVTWDSDGVTCLEPRANLLAEDSREAAEWIRPRIEAAARNRPGRRRSR